MQGVGVGRALLNNGEMAKFGFARTYYRTTRYLPQNINKWGGGGIKKVYLKLSFWMKSLRLPGVSQSSKLIGVPSTNLFFIHTSALLLNIENKIYMSSLKLYIFLDNII